MKLTEIRDRAKQLGVPQSGKMRKGDLIRATQRQENNQDCFGISWRFDCQQYNCCWREDCLTTNPG